MIPIDFILHNDINFDFELNYDKGINSEINNLANLNKVLAPVAPKMK